MTEQQIMTILQRKRRYETEIAILRDCSDELNDYNQSHEANNYAILKRRLALIDHWLNYLSAEERSIVEMRLYKNKTWLFISEQVQENSKGRLPCDERTVQRQMERAIASLYQLMSTRFGSNMDFLIDHSK